MTRIHLTFLTPLFSKGSYDDRPEIRPASVRGQLHWWFRALDGSYADENTIFGSVHSKPVQASKVVVRVANITGDTGELNTLPHKSGGQASPKWAFKAGTAFDLIVSERLGGLDSRHRTAFQSTLEAWLLLGTLGLRATRAAGSFTWQITEANGLALANPQQAYADYSARCESLLKEAPLRFHLLPKPYSLAEVARKVVSDTLGGREDRQGETDLAHLNHPLGRISGGRKTSPLRFRIVQLGQQFHIAAVWDNRTVVTGNRTEDFAAVIDLLASRGKEIGKCLKAVSPSA